VIFRDSGAIMPEGVSHDPEILKRVLLRKGEAPHVLQLATVDFEPGQTAAAHAHDGMVEVFLCEAGSGSVDIDGQAHAIRPGTMFVCEPGEVHEVGSAEGMRLTVIAIEI
jgi:quercetin dioxygenase-like cupin family protein